MLATLDALQKADRALLVLNVPWSGFARSAVTMIEKASDQLGSLGIPVRVVDEESPDVRAWLNSCGPSELHGDCARGGGSLLWLENGSVVDFEIAGYTLTIPDLLERTIDRWSRNM